MFCLLAEIVGQT